MDPLCGAANAVLAPPPQVELADAGVMVDEADLAFYAGVQDGKEEEPPEINAELINRNVDVAWELTCQKRDGGEYTRTCWCRGVIKRVSTGSTRIDGSKAGRGWIFVEYTDGSSAWLRADRPTFFNAQKAGAWRFAPEDDDDAAADDEHDSADEHGDLVDADEAENDDMSDSDDDD